MDSQQPQEPNKKPEAVKPKKTTFLGRILTIVNKIRAICGLIVENPVFQYVILILIIINAIMMAIATYDFVKLNPERKEIFDLADDIFLYIFTVELGLNLIYYGLYLFTNGWLIFDFTTILFTYAFAQVGVIRAFRVFRAFRLITKVKTLKNLVSALLSVIPRVSAIFALLMLVLYIFSVMFTSLYGDLEFSEPFFDQLHNSAFTLLQMLTLDWIEITREVIEVDKSSQLLIILWVCISGFVVYNLFVGVVCDAIYAINEDKDDDHESVLKDEDGPRLQNRIKELTVCVEKIQNDQNRLHAYVEDLAQALLELEEIQESG